jgi:CDP-diacylglycerol--serine O-phosphatidyltransferase
VARLPRIPDLLTTANLACGVGAVLLASHGQLTIACGLLFLAALFDVFDGLAARALGGGTPMGAQLDSLADMVSFGLAPAVIVFHRASPWLAADRGDHWMLWATAVVMSVCSGWRLAKFNIDTRQTSGFLGLPTPAHALFWVSAVLMAEGYEPWSAPMRQWPGAWAVALFTMPAVLLGLSVLLGALMLSEVPLPSLKFSGGKWRGNEVIFLLISAGALLVIALGIPAVPVILGLYLLSPLWGRLFPSSRT